MPIYYTDNQNNGLDILNLNVLNVNTINAPSINLNSLAPQIIFNGEATITYENAHLNINTIINPNGVKSGDGAIHDITVGASPFNFNNNTASNIQVLISGGAIDSITLYSNNGNIFVMNNTLSAVILRVGDNITIDFTTAPSMAYMVI